MMNTAMTYLTATGPGRALRIALICHAAMGGSSQAALQLARALQRRGHQVLILSAAPPFGHAADGDPPLLLLPVLHGDIPAAPADWALRDTGGLAESLASGLAPLGIDVVHFHYAHPFVQATAGLRRRLGTACPRLVCTLHGTDVFGLPGPAHAATAVALRALDAVTAVSCDLAARATGLLDIARPIVIPNFSEQARPAAAGPRPGRVGPARVVHVSNFRPVKRLPLLVEVFARLAATMDSRLWLVGDGPDRLATQQAIASLGLTDRTVWFGARHDVPRLLADADIALLTSAYESFSLFALEAMVAGLPVAGFDVGGLREVVGRDDAALLLPFGDTAGLAAAMAGLLQAPLARERMGQEAREAAARFAEPMVVPRYEALYRALTGIPLAPTWDALDRPAA
jgi:N-acetyl-alpha-D-glucosaminyl L-malate synthase BshA